MLNEGIEELNREASDSPSSRRTISPTQPWNQNPVSTGPLVAAIDRSTGERAEIASRHDLFGGDLSEVGLPLAVSPARGSVTAGADADHSAGEELRRLFPSGSREGLAETLEASIGFGERASIGTMEESPAREGEWNSQPRDLCGSFKAAKSASQTTVNGFVEFDRCAVKAVKGAGGEATCVDWKPTTGGDLEYGVGAGVI